MTHGPTSARAPWRTVAAEVFCALGVAAVVPTLSSCAVPTVGSDARVPETIAVYMPPVGPHGRGSILILPVNVTKAAPHTVQAALDALGGEYRIVGSVAIHASATVESGAVIKGPAIIGPEAFVAAGAHLRGGVFLDRNCIVGPGCELKTSFMFSGSKLAHLNFVGDSVIGPGVNVEAGAIVANYRNELADKVIRIAAGTSVIDTGVEKFGALIGDGVRIGANAVVAPGALIAPDSVIGRLGLIDQRPGARRGVASNDTVERR